MDFILEFLYIGITIYVLLILGWVILSWFPMGYDHPLRPVRSFLTSVVEPYLRIFRGLIPPVQMGGAALDPSPIIGIFLLFILRGILQGMVGGP